jgi:hypothetical protein
MINSEQQVPGVSTVDSPAATTNGANYLVAWTTSNQSLWWTTCPANSTQSSYDWTPAAAVPNAASSGGPALATFAGKVWMAWKGEGTDTRIYIASLSGSTWSDGGAISGIGTSNSPALAATASGLYLAFTGQSDDTVYWSKSSDGKTWSAQAAVPGFNTSDTPALAAFNGVVYIAAKGASDATIWLSVYNETKGWGTATALSSDFGTSSGPALGCGNTGNLHLVFKGESDTLIWESTLITGKTAWSKPAKVANTKTSARPALASQPSTATDIMLAFKGASTNDLWAAPLDNLPAIYPLPDGSQPAPTSISWSAPAPLPPAPPNGPDAPDAINFGSGASQAAFAGQLVLSSDGTATFSGWYQDQGNIPVFTAPSQDYTAGMVVLTSNKKCFTFSNTNNQGGGVASGGTVNTWNITQKNADIASNWAYLQSDSIAHISCTNNTDPASFIGAIVTAVEEVAGYVETAVEVIGVIAAVV